MTSVSDIPTQTQQAEYLANLEKENDVEHNILILINSIFFQLI